MIQIDWSKFVKTPGRWPNGTPSRWKITHQKLALACLFSIIIDILYPPFLTLSQLGSFPIIKNQWIATSENTDYLYENINPDFKVYFGDKRSPKQHLVRIETKGEVFELQLVRKQASPSATPNAIDTPGVAASDADSPGVKGSPTPTTTPSAKPVPSLPITPISPISPIPSPTPTIVFSPTPTATTSAKNTSAYTPGVAGWSASGSHDSPGVEELVNSPIGAPPETLAAILNPTPAPSVVPNEAASSAAKWDEVGPTPTPSTDPALAAALAANQQTPQSTFSGSLEQQTQEIQKDIESLSEKIKEVKEQTSKFKEFVQSLEEVTLVTLENGQKAVIFLYPSEFVKATYTIIDSGIEQKIEFYGSGAFPLDFKINNGLTLTKEPDETAIIKSASQNPFLKLAYTKGKANGRNLGSDIQTTFTQNQITINANSSLLFFTEMEKENIYPIELTHIFSLFIPPSSRSQTISQKKGKPKVLGLSASSTPAYRYENKNEDFTARLIGPLGSASYQFERKGGVLEVTLDNQDLPGKVTSVDNTTITIPNVQKGVDLSYQIVNEGIKEKIILKEASSPAVFSFTMRTTNLDVVRDYDNLYHFFDKNTAEDLTVFRKLFMDDSSGNHSEAVAINVEPTGKETDEIALWKVTLTADPAFLTDPKTVFPVTIDPTVEIGTSSFATKIEKQIHLRGPGELSTTATTYNSTPTTIPLYYHETGVWTPAPTVYFEAVIKSNSASYTAKAALLPKGSATAVTNSEVTTTGTSYSRQRSAAITLSNATEYTAQFRTTSGGTAYFMAGRLIVIQETLGVITETATYHFTNAGQVTTSTTYGAHYGQNALNYSDNIWLYQAAVFDGTVTIYYEADIRSTSASVTGYSQLEVLDSTSGLGAVSSSSTTTTRVRSAAISPTGGTAYEAGVKSGTSGTQIALDGGFVIILQSVTSGRIARTEDYRYMLGYTGAITNTTYTEVQTQNYWDPANYVNTANVYYHESSLYGYDGGGTTYSDLYNTTDNTSIDEIAQAGYGDYNIHRVRSAALSTMPTAAKTMTERYKVSTGTTQYIGSSKLIIRLYIISPGAPTAYSFQRKTFYDHQNNTHWSFFGGTSSIYQYYASDTATSWTSCSGCTAISEIANDFSLWYNEGVAYLARTDGYDVVIQKGTVSATSISWAAAVIVLNGTGYTDRYLMPFVARDKSSGYVWVTAQYYDGTNFYVYTARSTNSGDNVSAWDAATNLHTASSTNETNVGVILPTGGDNMYAAWQLGGGLYGKRYVSGTGWDASPTTITTSGVSTEYTQTISATTDKSNDIHLAYIDTSNYVQYKMYDTSANSWDASATQLDGTSSNAYLSTTFQESNQTIYVFWIRSSTLYYLHRTQAIDSWDSSPVSLATLTSGIYLTSTYTTSENIVTMRTEGTTSPYSVKEDRFSTGMKSLLRHGRTFENETKQRFAY